MSLLSGWYIEKKILKSGKFRAYLVKDIQSFNKKRKVRFLLDTDHDIQQSDVNSIVQSSFNEFISKLIDEKAKLAKEYYIPLFLSSDGIYNLEQIKEIVSVVIDQYPINEINLYKKNIEYQYIHGTTWIEGNTLNLQQVKDVLENGYIPSGKSLREINEIQNYKQVINYRRKHKGKITLSFIKKIHQLALSNTGEIDPGAFRNNDFIGISGCDYQVCPSVLIEESLEAIIEDYYSKLQLHHHPFELALYFHYCFEMIHPFNDGNGRVGRELLNYLLEGKGFPQYLVIGTDRDNYLQALKYGNESFYDLMMITFLELYNAFYTNIFESDYKNKRLNFKVNLK